ncbi:hypothetical protein BGZ50_001306, partial [Haplosporangium sp. Z 11]
LLVTLPLDSVWETLQSTVMSAAYAHLPCTKTGGSPRPRGEANLRARISDLGHIIKLIRTTFTDTQPANTALKQKTWTEMQEWYWANRDELGLGPIPRAHDDQHTWQAWTETLQQQWSVSRLLHRDYLKAHRQQIINSHIDRRNARFETHTRQTIKSILDVTNGRVHLDHLIVEDDPGGLYVTDDPVDIKRRVRQYFCDTFHAERVCQPLEGRWADAYQPRPDIDEQWYDELMDTPTRQEILNAITSAPD